MHCILREKDNRDLILFWFQEKLFRGITLKYKICMSQFSKC